LRRKSVCAALLALPLVFSGTLAQAQAKPPIQGGLTLEEPGRINTSALFGATLYDLDNQAVLFSAHRGRPMIINFWARWCPPCRVEIPELVALQQQKTGVDIIGINIETDPAPVRDFGRAYDINYPVLLTRAPGIDLMRSLGNSKAGLPFTVVLNKQGEVVASRMGAMTRAQLELAVERALR
jgi:thiol-disulfide isomerase/thioredoxin